MIVQLRKHRHSIGAAIRHNQVLDCVLYLAGWLRRIGTVAEKYLVPVVHGSLRFVNGSVELPILSGWSEPPIRRQKGHLI